MWYQGRRGEVTSTEQAFAVQKVMDVHGGIQKLKLAVSEVLDDLCKHWVLSHMWHTGMEGACGELPWHQQGQIRAQMQHSQLPVQWANMRDTAAICDWVTETSMYGIAGLEQHLGGRLRA